MPDVKPKRLNEEEYRAIYEMGVIANSITLLSQGERKYGHDVYALLRHIAAIEAEHKAEIAEAKREADALREALADCIPVEWEPAP